jgi:L-lactate dehydrogenase complex protein LldE
MNVGLLVTCLVDLMRPNIGFAAVRLLERAGCCVHFPEAQTCCAQPAFNAGERALARTVAAHMVSAFEGLDYVVAPSGSCAAMVKKHYPDLLSDHPLWHEKAKSMADRTFELTDFLVRICRFEGPFTPLPLKITYHDSCSGLRDLHVRDQPRTLLSRVEGLCMQEMDGCEECCGFGGAFSVKFGEISARIAQRKCELIHAIKADAVVLGDLGCMLHIEGRLRRIGDETTRVLHVAEVLDGLSGRTAPEGV